MSIQLYLAYLFACMVIVIVPGPTTTLVIANSLNHGTRAGLLNVGGTQIGVAAMIGVVALGLASTMEAMGHWFDWLRLAGAAYLIWLGWKLLRASGNIAAARGLARPRGGFFLQGLLVALSNPKMLLLFGAFIPQFIDPAGDYLRQVLILGGTAMAFAALSDSTYALLSGRASRIVSQRRLRLVSRLSGGLLIGGGLWLAFSRSR
jgi:homoserine/homoserine lactone efflux protein